jgi:hypothetical protein
MLLSFPADPRSLLESFSFYDEAAGLEGLARQIDFEGASQHQLYYGTRGRVASGDDIKESESGSARAYFVAMLKSDDFQSNVLPLALSAYPEKKRLVFIHVPKCAGTDLCIHLSRRFPTFAANSTVGWRVPKEELYRRLRRLVLELRSADTIFVHGHLRLESCLETGIVRPSDRIVTIIRAPEEIVISKINYVLSQIMRANEHPAGSTREAQRWIGILREHELSADMLASDPQSFLKKMLRHPKMGRRNTICNALGNGDAGSALINAKLCDIEITTVENYNSWLREHWGITVETAANRSRKFLTKDMLDDGDFAYLDSITSEDRRVYDLVSAAIGEAGTASIRGRDLERLLDPV